MVNKTSHLYNRTALLLAMTLAIVLLGLTVERNTFNITLIIAGCIAGVFVLDLDYIIHAYFVEPNTTFSKTLISYVKHKDIHGLLAFIKTHKNDIEDKTLNSALFQIVLGGAALFVLSASVSIFLRSLILSAFLNSIYRFGEEYLRGRVKQWFWSLKVDTTKSSIYGYTFILLITFLYCLTLY